MEKFQQTNTWKNTLGLLNFENQFAIDKLKDSFLSCREKSTILAGEIHRSLPNYTVHDISHIDALWEMADTICGENYDLNPVEGFVLGGAFLLHDLAMSIYAYPKGIAELEELDLWKDTVSQRCKYIDIPIPKSTRYDDLHSDVKEYTLSTVLRKLHANSAEKLATIAWTQPSTGDQIFLIDNPEIRQSLGKIIGKIAHSHWWDISKVEREFARPIGSPSWCPADWKIDPLKLACILRVADASHIDARRAPTFLRSLRQLNSYSDEHWSFQEKLQKPYLSDDSLFYTSGYSFPRGEASSWWLCYEALKMIDKELRQTDALLADKGMERFKAKRVFGIESPERLGSLIQCEDWSPIDAFIHIGDLPKIIRNLGGEELYGRDMSVPIRELIQNASDAIRARRALESRSEVWGAIKITKGKNDNGFSYIEVEDNGIGMSLDVIKNYLFDFGSSYWGSELMLEEYPGLMAKDVPHVGKYGIGFFSAFMLGDNITITTRKCTSAQQDTNVVEFRNGLGLRPIIRKATSNEYLIDGGTKIKIEFDEEKFKNALLTRNQKEIVFHDFCLSIAPALDIDMTITDEATESIDFSANYWINCSNDEFIKFMFKIRDHEEISISEDSLDVFMDNASKNLQTITDEHGDIIGRAFLNTRDSPSDNFGMSGTITVGGLKESKMSFICGILCGENKNAARNEADVIAKDEALGNWASIQADLVSIMYDKSILMEMAQIVRILGGRPGKLPIAKANEKYYTYEEMNEIIKDSENISFASRYFYDYRAKDFSSLDYLEDVYFSEISGYPGVFHNGRNSFYSTYEDRFVKMTLLGYMLEIIEEQWNVPVEKLIDFTTKAEYSEIVIGNNGEIPIREHGYTYNKKLLQ